MRYQSAAAETSHARIAGASSRNCGSSRLSTVKVRPKGIGTARRQYQLRIRANGDGINLTRERRQDGATARCSSDGAQHPFSLGGGIRGVIGFEREHERQFRAAGGLFIFGGVRPDKAVIDFGFALRPRQIGLTGGVGVLDLGFSIQGKQREDRYADERQR